jgi:hypothetical protein
MRDGRPMEFIPIERPRVSNTLFTMLKYVFRKDKIAYNFAAFGGRLLPHCWLLLRKTD